MSFVEILIVIINFAGALAVFLFGMKLMSEGLQKFAGNKMRAIMGKVTGLNAAVILLSLSIWGSLLGFVGLIVALPLTTLIVSYYKRYVLEETEEQEEVKETKGNT